MWKRFHIRRRFLTSLTISAPPVKMAGLFYLDEQIHYSQKNTTMGNILYIIAVILIIAWAIGYLGYSAGGLIHILLVIAVIAILLRLIRGSGV